MDVLARPRRQTKEQPISAFLPRIAIKEEHFPTGGLAQLGRHLSMMLQSREEFIVVSVTSQEFEFPFVFWHSMFDLSFFRNLHIRDAQREQAVRAFFKGQGMEASGDYEVSDYGGANLYRQLDYPLPIDAAGAITLTTDLLRSVYGLGDGAGLDFSYYEMETSA